eukprot:5341723-Alexandrium_andersonii.AAC.1
MGAVECDAGQGRSCPPDPDRGHAGARGRAGPARPQAGPAQAQCAARRRRLRGHPQADAPQHELRARGQGLALRPGPCALRGVAACGLEAPAGPAGSDIGSNDGLRG